MALKEEKFLSATGLELNRNCGLALVDLNKETCKDSLSLKY